MDLAGIREEGVTLQVVTEWGPWGPCKQCIYNRGIKTSRGYCRLKRSINSASIIYIYIFLFYIVVNRRNYIFLLFFYYFFINRFINTYIIILDNAREKRFD